jgi:hypothetical protein
MTSTRPSVHAERRRLQYSRAVRNRDDRRHADAQRHHTDARERPSLRQRPAGVNQITPETLQHVHDFITIPLHCKVVCSSDGEITEHVSVNSVPAGRLCRSGRIVRQGSADRTGRRRTGGVDGLVVDVAQPSRSRRGSEGDARSAAGFEACDHAYTRRLQLYRGEIGPDAVITPADTDEVQVATLAYGLGNWYLLRGDQADARKWFERSIQSGGWPGFGFIASEVELRRLR